MKKRVLIVDDSATVRAQVSALLQGYELVLACDGEDALRVTEKNPPDAAVIDLEMPRLDGVHLLQRFRANPTTKHLPVIVMTTVTAVDQVNACRALGCSGFVLKPVDGEYLKAKVRHLVNGAPGKKVAHG